MSRFGNRVQSAVTVPVLAAAAVGFLTACGADTVEDEGPTEVYCADQDGVVVDDDLCEDDAHAGGTHFLYVGSFGGNTYRTGDRIPSRYLSGSARIRPGDAAARRGAGLPGTGKVTGGTRVSGGIGAGPGARGGSGGG